MLRTETKSREMRAASPRAGSVDMLHRDINAFVALAAADASLGIPAASARTGTVDWLPVGTRFESVVRMPMPMPAAGSPSWRPLASALALATTLHLGKTVMQTDENKCVARVQGT